MHLRSPFVALIAASAAWGIGTVVSKAALDTFPPLILLPIQLAASLVGLTVLMRWRGLPLRVAVDPVLARLGLLNPGLSYALSLVGLTMISASLSVLLWVVEPLLIVGLAVVVLHEPLRPLVLPVSGLAALGMILLLLEPGLAGDALGIALTLAGVLCCAVYTIVARRRLGDADTPSVVVAQQAHALVLALGLAVAAVALGGAAMPTHIPPEALAAAIGSGLLYYGAAYWLYLSALARLPAITASASFYLIPLFGLAAAMIVLRETLVPLQWVGAVLVVGSVTLLLRSGSAEPVSRPSSAHPAGAASAGSPPQA